VIMYDDCHIRRFTYLIQSQAEYAVYSCYLTRGLQDKDSLS